MAILTLTHTDCSRARKGTISLFSLISLYRQRRALASLTAAQLDDLGLTRDEALHESRKPLWDIPVQRNSCR